MNYQLIYKKLINRAANRSQPVGYLEKHHIIPKCLGGKDDKTNLVKLTGREHFIAHWLLHRIYPDNKSLASAFFFMSHCISGKRNYKVSSIAYEEARVSHAKAMSITLTGIVRSQETRDKLSNRVITKEWRDRNRASNKGKLLGRKISEKHKQQISIANKGRKLSQREKDRVSEVHKGKKLSQEQIEMLREINKNKKLSSSHKIILSRKAKETSTCPHCNKLGQNINMQRWHFDNCKTINQFQSC